MHFSIASRLATLWSFLPKTSPMPPAPIADLDAIVPEQLPDQVDLFLVDRRMTAFYVLRIMPASEE